ncbi:MAG: TatD family hydrolase [Planctomycetota bacterium]|nr:TatD family hydrolase [Planctomycetota bacterium]
MLKAFDSHCHLDMDKFDIDREEVISRARKSGVLRMVSVASSTDSFETTMGIARNHDGIYPALGVSRFQSRVLAP